MTIAVTLPKQSPHPNPDPSSMSCQTPPSLSSYMPQLIHYPPSNLDLPCHSYYHFLPALPALRKPVNPDPDHRLHSASYDHDRKTALTIALPLLRLSTVSPPLSIKSCHSSTTPRSNAFSCPAMPPVYGTPCLLPISPYSYLPYSYLPSRPTCLKHGPRPSHLSSHLAHNRNER